MVKEKLKKFKDTVTNNPSFTLKEQLGYSGGIFGNTMGQDSVGTFFEKFSRNFMGIDSTKYTLIDNISLAAKLIANPIAGNFLDRPAKRGKRTPTKTILFYAPIPFAITSMLLFIVPTENSLYNFIWAVLLKIAFEVVDCFYDMALLTMSLRMTNNSRDRKNFYTISTLAGSLGSMLPGWIIPIIVSRTDDAMLQKWLYFIIALIFCLIGVSAMFAPYFTLTEKLHVEIHDDEKSAPIAWDRETISAILHNRTFLVVQGSIFFERIRQCSYNLLLYLYDDVFDDYGMKAIIDAISGALSYLGLASVPIITSKFSARTVLSMSFGYTGVFYGIMSLFSVKFNIDRIRKFRYLIGLCIGLAGMPNQAISAAKKVVIGDSTDYMEWYSEKHFGHPIRSEGLVSSVNELSVSVFRLIAMNIYNPLFKVIGYKESTITKGQSVKAVQSNDTLRGLYLMFTLFGLIGNFCASAVYQLDNYTGAKKEAILEELSEMRAKRAEITNAKASTETN